MLPSTATHKNVPLFAILLIKAWLTTQNISKDQTTIVLQQRGKMITAFEPSKPNRPRTHCLKQDQRMKKRILFVNDENIYSYCIWKIYCHMGHKMEGVPQLAVQDLKTTCSKKNETSTQYTLQQSNTTYCVSFTTWTAHKWCLPSQTMISIPSLMWRPRGTISKASH